MARTQPQPLRQLRVEERIDLLKELASEEQDVAKAERDMRRAELALSYLRAEAEHMRAAREARAAYELLGQEEGD